MTTAVMPVDELEDLSGRLEQAFQDIYQQRMADLPVVNKKIAVHAIGFQHWQQSVLGVMITPWFMNLMMLPGKDENWADKPLQTNSYYVFPSGRYAFLMGYEKEIGYYQSCSLFSPMFEFQDDEAAVETAKIIIKELMNSENVEQLDIPEEDVEKPVQTNDMISTTDQEVEPVGEKIKKPMSRRRLLGLG